MNHTQYLKYLKHLILKCLISLLFCLMLTEKAASIPFPISIPPWGGTYPILDFAVVTALKTTLPSYTAMANSARVVAAEYQQISEKLEAADESLKKANIDYKKNVDLTVLWNKDTDPNLVALKASLSPIMAQLKVVDTNAKQDLDDYEKEYFFNNKADVNKGKRYGREDATLADTIEKNSMCQKAPNNGNTYAKLREKSCAIVHNATAYKKALYDFTLQKQDLLKKAMKMIMDSSLVTIGEHDARKTMLLELEVLYQEITDDFKLRSNNADVQAHIARDTELYAAQAIDFGVNSSVVMEGAKAAIGGAILLGLAVAVPYNE